MGDDNRRDRSTVRFEREALLALAKRTLIADEPATAAEAKWSQPPEIEGMPLIGRAPTQHDPMTTALMVEVTRRAQTLEIDADTIDDAIRMIDAGETSHPHTRRRVK